jgi:hypothetical protein
LDRDSLGKGPSEIEKKGVLKGKFLSNWPFKIKKGPLSTNSLFLN